uniref:Uncharacterized protein n=1 Tax=Compsopogon caeruleus TaxID=31354 RepID=A0A1Z1XAX5_9RHOD|nr:hypothetical protein [Compsopogon caeruleus]ARX96013.1 hypothetical protein [Compsopogon caeruleus]
MIMNINRKNITINQFLTQILQLNIILNIPIEESNQYCNIYNQKLVIAYNYLIKDINLNYNINLNYIKNKNNQYKIDINANPNYLVNYFIIFYGESNIDYDLEYWFYIKAYIRQFNKP